MDLVSEINVYIIIIILYDCSQVGNFDSQLQ